MDITRKPDRTALKSFFVKNAIPTASNFADLIDGAINQRDDGIVKLAGEPLSLQADGDDTSQKKAINFYKNFADPKPAWTLSLNPRTDPNNPATAKPGWSIGDADGNSKFFIDRNTGHIGIGTAAPAAKLHVNGDIQIAGGKSFSSEGSLEIGSQETLQLYGWDGVKIDGGLQVSGGSIMPAAGNNAGSGIRFPSDPGGGGGDAAWIRFYPRSGESCTLELGISNDGDDHIALMPSGNVGIGTTAPRAKLEVNGGIYAGNSDIYFTKTDHDHTGIGNTLGWAAIENGKGHDCLMIIGRTVNVNPINRKVGLWDRVEVHGTFVNSSDAREKRDVTDLDYGLKEIIQLRPVSFNWKEIANPHKSMGLVAQEVMPILEEAVYQDKPEPDAHLSIAYTSLIPVLINAIKELAAKVEQLSGKVAAKAG
ncbi:MAG: tail fiber domain-containing protein [Aestuariivirga sp.]